LPHPSNSAPLFPSLPLPTISADHRSLVDYPNPINESYGWHFQYLTILGLTLSTLTFACGSLSDISSSRTLFRLKNTFSVLAAPLEILITLLYFSLRLVDKSLVIPDWAQLPLVPDLSFHLFPTLFLAIDFLLLSPPWTISLPESLALSSAFATGYWFWVEQCYRHNGYLPYPIFEMIGTEQRIGLFAFAAALLTGCTMALGWVYVKMNGKIMEVLQGEQDKKKKKKK